MQALPRADVVVLATSSDKPFVSADAIRHGAIVCDIARPSNVLAEVSRSRPDVCIFDGGLARVPFPVDFGPQVDHFQGDVIVGCLAETILLALEGHYADYSVGPELSPSHVPMLKNAMMRHGFEPAWLARS